MQEWPWQHGHGHGLWPPTMPMGSRRGPGFSPVHQRSRRPRTPANAMTQETQARSPSIALGLGAEAFTSDRSLPAESRRGWGADAGEVQGGALRCMAAHRRPTPKPTRRPGPQVEERSWGKWIPPHRAHLRVPAADTASCGKGRYPPKRLPRSVHALGGRDMVHLLKAADKVPTSRTPLRSALRPGHSASLSLSRQCARTLPPPPSQQCVRTSSRKVVRPAGRWAGGSVGRSVGRSGLALPNRACACTRRRANTCASCLGHGTLPAPRPPQCEAAENARALYNCTCTCA